jgi:hypothetical protein
VEEVFVREAFVLELQVGGRVIRTTAEHPFFPLRTMDWTPVAELQTGDVLRGETGDIRVEAIEDTGEYASVYNCRVADWHTYFVGCEERGVWAHNTYDELRRYLRTYNIDPEDHGGVNNTHIRHAMAVADSGGSQHDFYRHMHDFFRQINAQGVSRNHLAWHGYDAATAAPARTIIDPQQAAHADFATNQAALETTINRMGRQALAQGGNDWVVSEAIFHSYAEQLNPILVGAGSNYRVAIEPAATVGSSGTRVGTRTRIFPNQADGSHLWGRNHGRIEIEPQGGVLRPDVGLVDLNQPQPLLPGRSTPLYQVVAGFDISYRPVGSYQVDAKPFIGGHYQGAYGDIPIFDIRPHQTWVQMPHAPEFQGAAILVR